jgi:beta-lactamase regulating signal transducer with metallopeptidase domain
MGAVFLKVLNMSITAGWFILAVLCIRLLFRKIPKWMNCLLWGVVAIRLICPFSIESPFSILSSTEPIKSSAVVEGEVRNDIPSIDSRLTIVQNTINPMLTETFAYNESDSVAPLQVVTFAAGLVWCCGMVLLIICAMGSVVKLHKLVNEAVCVRENIYICDAVKSPFILGIFRPRIYFSSALREREMDYILAHESAHLKRKDHWWKALGYLLLCIHWFNPLCWVAYSLLCKDIELACDEKAAKNMTFHEKKEYAKVLLSCAGQRSLVMVCPLAFGEVGVKERVKSVLNYKKPTVWIMMATAAVFVILAVCFLTNPTKGDVELQNPIDENKDVYESVNSPSTEQMPSEEMQEENDTIQNIMLYEQPESDKVCIKVQPAMIAEYAYYYYIPTDKDQEWLSAQVEALDLEGQPFDKRWEGHKEKGWQIIYNDMEIRVFEGGYLYYTYDDEKGLKECFIEAPKLCDDIQTMLTEEIGYQNYDVSDIKDIVSAKLDVKSMFTGGKLYSQTITDDKTLQKFEAWFRNAEYMYGGTECGTQCACLELILANGDVVKLSMATDSCPNFHIGGVAYDYRPVTDWNNSEFYKCFNEIPWEYE